MEMMEEDLGEREKNIAEIKQFIEKECAEIGELLALTSWTPDFILKRTSLTQCPYDCGHQMPESSLKQHAAVCRLRKMGFSTQEVETELQKDDIFYTKAPLVGKVQLDEGLLNRVVWNHSMENRQVHRGHRTMPESAIDYVVKLSAQERLAVYEHCVHTLKSQGKMANVDRDEVLTTDWERIVKKGMLEQGGERPKTRFELMALLRDQKRRRQTYRAKNVHVTKKSYTEIIREVIQNQIDIMMPSAEVKEEGVEEEEDSTRDGDIANRSQHSDPNQSRNRSRSPKRRRNHSRSPKRERYDSRSPKRQRHHSRSRSPSRRRQHHRENRTPRRSRSRSRTGSQSPRRKDRGRGRRREDDRRQPSDLVSQPDRDHDEGQIDSSDRRQPLDLVSQPDRDHDEGQIDSSDRRQPSDLVSQPDRDHDEGQIDSSDRRQPSDLVSQPDRDHEEGQIDSSDEEDRSHRRRSRHSKKKSSKRKKSKRKKHKSRSHHSDSD
ncbi:hypothetical protein ACOMHN_027105 [Nucella lapillus]